MTESRPEQRPLLCDEYSDEELQLYDTSPNFHRRFRHSFSSGRAKTHAIGAAAIITRWPDHVSTLLAYWWIGLGMIAVTVFVIYNSIAAIAVLPPTYNNKPLKMQNSQFTTKNTTYENSSALNVYMHVFVSTFDEFNIDNYIRYIDAMAKKFVNFKYNFIVVSNDVTQDVTHDLNDEQKNEMALNSLWKYNLNKNTSNRKLYENFSVKLISVTKYFDDSPLKKYWRLLPYQFIGFLARLIAIWNKGGVAFNPLILTPKTPNPIYLEKLYDILRNFQSKNKLVLARKRKISKKKFNNIRDIIYNLENEDRDTNIFPDSLSEAENIQTVTIKSLKSKRNVKSFNQYNYNSSAKTITQKNAIIHMKNINLEDSKSTSRNFYENVQPINSTQKTTTTKQNHLPNFFEFIFHVNSKNSTLTSQKLETSTRGTILSEYLHLKSKQPNNLTNDSIFKVSPAHNITNVKRTTKFINKTFGENEISKLIIDLKGNIIATNTACHAFIGTVFSNVLHHTDVESLTDFVITELSLFCKGNLSTCDGVEVILL